MIVDTHVHVISDDHKRFPKIAKPYEWPEMTAEMLLATMDQCGIGRALLVQPYFTYHFDNSYQAEAALAHRDRFLCVCVLDQVAPAAPDILSDLVENHGVRGVRFMHIGDKGIHRDPRAFPLWQRAIRHGIPICVAASLDEIADVRVVLDKFPEATVALEHMWATTTGDPPYDSLKPVMELARFPNLRLKICPNNSHAARVGKSTPRAFFGMVAEHFGARRMMWGSNYPAHWDKYGKIPERLALMQADLAFLPEDDRRWFFGETALTLWPGLR